MILNKEGGVVLLGIKYISFLHYFMIPIINYLPVSLDKYI
jgi:hypothetical protein